MKAHRLIIALTTLLLTAVPPLSSAADFTVDISSFAPRDPTAVLAQIELNAYLKQYEKVLSQMEDIRLEFALGNEGVSADATDEQKKQPKANQEKRESEYRYKMQALEDRLSESRRSIIEIMKTASAMAADFETEQGKAMQTTEQTQPTATTLRVSGKSSGPTNLNGGTVTATTGQNAVTATGKEEGKASVTGTLLLTPGQPATQAGTLNINGEALKSGITLIFTTDPNKATTPPKAPQAGTLDLNGPLTLKGSNEYTNPTNVPANVQPTPAK